MMLKRSLILFLTTIALTRVSATSDSEDGSSHNQIKTAAADAADASSHGAASPDQQTPVSPGQVTEADLARVATASKAVSVPEGQTASTDDSRPRLASPAESNATDAAAGGTYNPFDAESNAIDYDPRVELNDIEAELKEVNDHLKLALDAKKYGEAQPLEDKRVELEAKHKKCADMLANASQSQAELESQVAELESQMETLLHERKFAEAGEAQDKHTAVMRKLEAIKALASQERCSANEVAETVQDVGSAMGGVLKVTQKVKDYASGVESDMNTCHANMAALQVSRPIGEFVSGLLRQIHDLENNLHYRIRLRDGAIARANDARVSAEMNRHVFGAMTEAWNEIRLREGSSGPSCSVIPATWKQKLRWDLKVAEESLVCEKAKTERLERTRAAMVLQAAVRRKKLEWQTRATTASKPFLWHTRTGKGFSTIPSSRKAATAIQAFARSTCRVGQDARDRSDSPTTEASQDADTTTSDASDSPTEDDAEKRTDDAFSELLNLLTVDKDTEIEEDNSESQDATQKEGAESNDQEPAAKSPVPRESTPAELEGKSGPLKDFFKKVFSSSEDAPKTAPDAKESGTPAESLCCKECADEPATAPAVESNEANTVQTADSATGEPAAPTTDSGEDSLEVDAQRAIHAIFAKLFEGHDEASDLHTVRHIADRGSPTGSSWECDTCGRLVEDFVEVGRRLEAAAEADEATDTNDDADTKDKATVEAEADESDKKVGTDE